MSSTTWLWLRAEKKPLEKRSPLSPSTAEFLLKNNFKITVERSKNRIYDDKEFEAIDGIEMVDEDSWLNAPLEAIIIGLKELPETDDFPLKHEHIHFAHCFKNQTNWQHILRRFKLGGGTLYDLEFLSNPDGSRVAAFGYFAGFGGSAIALECWARQILSPNVKFENLQPYENQIVLINHVSQLVEDAKLIYGKLPRAIVIGAKGRCGKGAVDFLKACKLDNILEWDLDETKLGGPFAEITGSEIFINCIYLRDEIPPFITKESLDVPNRKLSVICDVSCDYTNPLNPLPIYHELSTFTSPTIIIDGFDNPRLEVISIDHIPTYLPREASDNYSKALMPAILTLPERNNDGIWQRAKSIFLEKSKLIGSN